MKKVIIFICLVFFLILSNMGQAATFTVTKTADTNDGTCDADCSLREAIIAANAAVGADVITLPAGTYILSIAGTDEDAAATGDLDITDDLTINGAGTSNTVIDGGALDRVFHKILATANISAVTIQNGLLTEDRGAGFLNWSGVLVLDHVTVTGNVVNGTTSSAAGGGLFNTGEATVVSSTISNNQADRAGGIFNTGGSVLELRDSTISGNTARAGGGLRVFGTTILTNVTISDNNASGDGGGLRLSDDVTLINCTVASNSSGDDSALALRNDGTTLTLKNTILANGAKNCDVTGGIINSDGHNLDSDGSCGLAAPGDLSNIDPLLGSLKDNGGPTRTHALLTGSPAIDAGDNVGCPSTDQRGVARPKDGDDDGNAVCDIGAYELKTASDIDDVIGDYPLFSKTKFKAKGLGKTVDEGPGETLTLNPDSTFSLGSVEPVTGIFSLDSKGKKILLEIDAPGLAVLEADFAEVISDLIFDKEGISINPNDITVDIQDVKISKIKIDKKTGKAKGNFKVKIKGNASADIPNEGVQQGKFSFKGKFTIQ